MSTSSLKRAPLTGWVVGLSALFVIGALILALSALSAIPNLKIALTPVIPQNAPAFAADVEAKVAKANPARGDMLFNQYNCVTCHGIPNGVTAPYMKGIATRAASRRPYYSAAAYLYESITQPNAFVVPGFGANIMPQYFKQIIPERDLYDLIAWLLQWK